MVSKADIELISSFKLELTCYDADDYILIFRIRFWTNKIEIISNRATIYQHEFTEFVENCKQMAYGQALTANLTSDWSEDQFSLNFEKKTDMLVVKLYFGADNIFEDCEGKFEFSTIVSLNELARFHGAFDNFPRWW